ncbi:hypothetical protein UFOVP29_199 [uncultured Caudovirales phage]|uniref:Uncharacterized protein n=1 Tax=uncultured Caudovirales phage TaxID=2100421 RepID=A0A6J5KSN7_9CAUD|nr:hypothetical protein UFOVP29_199 [uncultured Caudovirales phage]
MAATDKNILITPNRGVANVQPTMSFVGNANVAMTMRVADDNSLSFENATGQLFSISNNVTTGTIFSVNDISGIPFILVSANGNVSLAPISGSVGIGTSSPASALHVVGETYSTTGFATTGDSSYFTPSGLSAIPNYGIGAPGNNFVALAGFAGLTFYTNQAERMRISSTGNVGIGTQSPTVALDVTGQIKSSANVQAASSLGAFNYGTLSYSDTNIMSQYTSNVNTYTQMILQNTSAGSVASADFVVSSNTGNSSTYYGNFGINSSTFTGSGALNLANATYVYSNGGDLALGTGTANNIRFVVNNGANDAVFISSTGLTSVAQFKTYSETMTAPAISSGNLTLDLYNGTVFNVSLSGSVTTVTISNTSVVAATAGSVASFVTIFNGTGSAYTVAWPASVRWPAATAPVITTTAGKRDVLTFFSTDSGVSWNSFISGQNL